MVNLQKMTMKALTAMFLFYCAAACATSAEKAPGGRIDKIDPSLLMEIERLKTSHQTEQEIAVLIRTKKEINADEKGLIEKEGGRIGSVIGDILTARIPARAISKIADFDFVVYIEKAKKQQLR